MHNFAGCNIPETENSFFSSSKKHVLRIRIASRADCASGQSQDGFEILRCKNNIKTWTWSSILSTTKIDVNLKSGTNT